MNPRAVITFFLLTAGLLANLPATATAKEIDYCNLSCGDAPVGDPVCGDDGNTYPNECELNVTMCWNPTIKVKSRGECPCAFFCMDEFDPVCSYDVEDGKYVPYPNKCEFNRVNCLASMENRPLVQKKCPPQCGSEYCGETEACVLHRPEQRYECVTMCGATTKNCRKNEVCLLLKPSGMCVPRLK